MSPMLFRDFVVSWAITDGACHQTEEIINWITAHNANTHVSIRKIPFDDQRFWFYDRELGTIHNRKNSFFSISGLVHTNAMGEREEQPIILQNEIGFLGFICKKIQGVLHFLVQAKIEPGNINKVQLSPTIQATKSNFTKAHGGDAPAYLEYFTGASPEEIIVDQIQSEQSSRFYKKRNRNMILFLDGEILVTKNHMWMTLGQIKALMKLDNLVNMDTRTVLSCIPYSLWPLSTREKAELAPYFGDQALFRSLAEPREENLFPLIYHGINEIKMFGVGDHQLVPLHCLKDWDYVDGIYRCCTHFVPFQAIYCEIEIEGREVTTWEQPLFEAAGIAVFGLITYVENGTRYFVVRAKEEVGAFDSVELGPTVQLEAGLEKRTDAIQRLFWTKLEDEKSRIRNDVLLSEEGGRFYHEQNRNVILELTPQELGFIQEPYFPVDFHTLNLLTQVNNCVNIQLRNLLSLLEVSADE